MIGKGKISSVMSDGGGFATVTPYNGGIVTPLLVVPASLADVLSVGDPVVYAMFPDNTGIILQRADGTGNASGDGTVSPELVQDMVEDYLTENPPAPGEDGEDGITPHIGDNGNWYIGDTDTGNPSRGEQGPEGPQGPQGEKGETGETGPVGPGAVAKLWENSSPTSSFAAQTVSLDLSEYNGISIYFKNKSNGTVFLSTGIIPVGGNFTLFYITSDPASQRRAGSVSTEGVTFATGYAASAESTACAIPVIIYGYKGIT